ncbi:MAG: hypothetical protein HY741_10395 [Chloroflexi bacterium]|nr:hypothetical protein [Chloroflexota bacterium]
MTEATASDRKQWSRAEIAEKLDAFEQGYARIPSQRQWAEDLGIPRSTLQHWFQRKEVIDADPDLVAFFESSVGVAFLQRLILAAHLVMTLMGPCGIRLVCLFLELTGLDHFVAASYGSQQQVSTTLEKAVVEFGQAEKQRLSAGMRPKEITVCEDETFHPEACLVAIEPVSDFILVEKYAGSRTAKEWTDTMEQATAGLAVKIVQSTSDEGKGILVAEKAAEAPQRHALHKRAAELLAPLNSTASPLKGLPPADLRAIEQVAQECAELFQRSSSCVEGRNGQLALRHHSLHRLRDQKLAALTIARDEAITIISCSGAMARPPPSGSLAPSRVIYLTGAWSAWISLVGLLKNAPCRNRKDPWLRLPLEHNGRNEDHRRFQPHRLRQQCQ